MATELLTPYFWSINQLFKYKFCVPVYQRPYSWQNDELNSLLSDIWNLPALAECLKHLH